MCLKKLLDKEEVPRDGTAWKVMRKVTDDDGTVKYYLVYRSNAGGVKVAGVWYRANQETVHVSMGGRYPSGFHMYRTRKEARGNRIAPSWRVVKVRYRRRVAYGTEGFGTKGHRVIVAKEMMIVEG